MVAENKRAGFLGYAQKSVHFAYAEGFGQGLSDFRAIDGGHRVFVNKTSGLGKAKEGAQGSQSATVAAGANAAPVTVGKEVLYFVCSQGCQIFPAVMLEKGKEKGEIGMVGSDGVFAQSTFDNEVLEKKIKGW